MKARALDGLHWRKQHPLGPYVLDFYCARAKLCLEVDGGAHEFSMERDARRDAWLGEQGIQTLRIPAEAVRVTPEAVLEHILTAAQARLNR
jgi:very-short-patch-repair endonuclease